MEIEITSLIIPRLDLEESSPEAIAVELVMRRDNVSAQEALKVMLCGIGQPIVTASDVPNYVSLFGSAKGGYGSESAIDDAIRSMREEW